MTSIDVKLTISHRLVNGDKVVAPGARFSTKNVDEKTSKMENVYENENEMKVT